MGDGLGLSGPFGPVPGLDGWPTSAEVLAELRLLDPDHWGNVADFHYSPVSGSPPSARAIAQSIARVSGARMMSGSGIAPTLEAAEARVAEYRDDPDYTIEIAQIEEGRHIGEWRYRVWHRDWEDM